MFSYVQRYSDSSHAKLVFLFLLFLYPEASRSRAHSVSHHAKLHDPVLKLQGTLLDQTAIKGRMSVCEVAVEASVYLTKR